MKEDFLAKLSTCWGLESLDITGCTNVEDKGILMLCKGEVHLRTGFPPTVPGLLKLTTLKLGHTKLTDHGLSAIMKAMPSLTHLELNRCELTDIGIKLFVKELPDLKFLDLTSISGINLTLIEEIKAKKPNLLIR
jgi:Leucine Rich repeat